jgi:cell division protein FtsL
MSLRITALIYMACFAALAMGLYLVKYSVQSVQRDVATLKQQLASEKESLHLLNAEWAYLNRPERLSRLAGRHLDMVALDSRQITEMKAIPAAADTNGHAVSSPMVRSASHVMESR